MIIGTGHWFIKSVDYDTDGEIENDKLPQEIYYQDSFGLSLF